MKKQILTSLLLALSVLFINGCATAPYNQAEPAAIDNRVATSKDYLLGTGDRIEVTVFGQDEISGEYLIDSRGDVALPLIQSVHAEGMTIEALQNAIEDELSPEYLSNPKVSVQVIQYRDIYVLGEVRNPGKFNYIPNMTLLQAIAVAGGHTYRGNEKGAEITRNTKKGMVTFNVPAKSFIEPGDTIIVKRRWF